MLYLTKKRSLSTDMIISVIILCFVFQDLLQMYLGIFQYWDEIVSVVLIVNYIIRAIRRNSIKRDDFVCILLAICVTLLGIIGNTITNIAHSTSAILMDIGNTFKFLLVFLGLSNISFRVVNKRTLSIVVAVVKVYTLILFIFAFVNLFKSIGMASEYRYGIRAYCFVYGIPGVVINHCTYIIVILFCERSIFRSKNLIYIVLNLLVMLSTLRSRAFALVALACILYYIFFIMEKANIRTYLVFIVIALFCIGYSQIETYFIDNTNAPRALFLRHGIELAVEHFPLGTGFGTFGSHAAAYYYSSLYYLLGFDLRYGMNPTQKFYLSDNYWPSILGQFGFIGFVLFAILLYRYFKSFHRYMLRSNTPCNRFVFWFVTLDILLSSIQSSYISHYSMVALMFISISCFGNNSTRSIEQVARM